MTKTIRVSVDDSASLRVRRGRDAFATIRGFVYQVELTILRWLELGNQEALELERGEDIDKISQQIADAQTDSWDRLLEQVKYRTRITMRTPGLRAALANFFEHRSLNPELSLRFRFTTNALPRREKLSPLPNGLTGVEAWRRIHAGEVSPTEAAELLGGLRQLLRGNSRPDGATVDSWRAWRAFLDSSSDQELSAFIAQVEIATASPQLEELRPRIERRLRDEGYADDDHTAAELYTVLFVAVFKKLSVQGLKRLTRADLLAEVAGRGPGARDSGLRAKLEELKTFVEERLAAVERDLYVLRAAVAARISPPGARHGDTRTFQLTTNYFGKELDPSSTFNHARELAGRNELLERALESCSSILTKGSGILVVGGAGGVGKSRFLLEAARRLEAAGLEVRWVRDHATPDTESLNELPDGQVVILCDDAHRRTDLGAVLEFVESRRDPTVVFLGVRPYGRDALRVAAFQAGIGLDRILDLGDLHDLERDDLVQLVAAELGPDDERWAEDMVRVTHGSTLVALVAARLLRRRRLKPGILSQDPEVHHVVFSSFEDEIYGRVSPDVDPSLARRTLELAAAIGPVAMEDQDLINRAAAFLGTDAPMLLRVVGALQEAGVLREQESGIRIVPDVLSDHILHRTLVAAGRTTHVELQIIEKLGSDVLSNVLRNVAELDWQLDVAASREGGVARVDVLEDVWFKFLDVYRASSTEERLTYLDRLQPVAAFQPAAVLDLCESIGRAPADEDRTQLDQPFIPGLVLDRVATLLAFIAQHESHYERVLDLLWRLGRDDRREPNRYPEHPIRTLEEVVRYAPSRHLWRQGRAIPVLRRWTEEDGWSRHAHSPLVVAHAILQTDFIEDRFDPRRNVVTFTRYGVNADVTRRFREEIIELLQELALGPEPRGRILAVDALREALNPPAGQFGHVVTDEEEGAFRAQYEAALNAVDRIRAASKDPLVRLRLRDGLQWVIRRTKLGWKRDRARELVKRFRETNEIKLARVWGQIFDYRSGRWKTVQKRIEQLTVSVTDRLISQARDADQLVERLVIQHERFEAAGLPSQPYSLLTKIAEKRPDLANDVASWIIHAKEGSPGAAFAQWLHVLLSVLRHLRPMEYTRLLSAATTSQRPELRRAVALTLRWAHAEKPLDQEEKASLRALLADPAAIVREAAVDALQRVPVGERAALLRFVEIRGSEAVASAVAGLWAYLPGTEHPRLRSEEARRLLGMLVEFPDLDRPNMHIEQMLVSLAKSHPLLVLDFILERVRREAAAWGDPDSDEWHGYDAVPYGSFDGVWSALRTSPERPAIVRRLLTAIVEEARAAPQWYREALDVAVAVMRWDEEVETALHEWMGEGRVDDVAALDRLFSAQPSGFVVGRRAFVAELLAWLAARDDHARRRIEEALRASALGPMGVRRSDLPNENHMRLRDEALAYAAELDARGREYRAAAAFYRMLAADIEKRPPAADHERASQERVSPEDHPWAEEN